MTPRTETPSTTDHDHGLAAEGLGYWCWTLNRPATYCTSDDSPELIQCAALDCQAHFFYVPAREHPELCSEHSGELDPMLSTLLELSLSDKVRFYYTHAHRCFDNSLDYYCAVEADIADVLAIIASNDCVYINGDEATPHPLDQHRWDVQVNGRNTLILEVFGPRCAVYPITRGQLWEKGCPR